MMAHHFFAALCAYALGRRVASSRLSAVALALVTMHLFVFTPSVVSQGHIWTERMLSWTPLALLCRWRLLETGKPLWGLGASLVLGVQILAGDLQMLLWQELVFALFLSAALGVRLVGRTDSSGAALRTLLTYACAMALGLGIGAVQWLPAWQLVNASTRNSGVSLDYIRSFSGVLDLPLVYAARLVIRWCFPSVLASVLLICGLFSRREPYRWAFVFTFVLVSLLTVWPDLFFATWMRHLPLVGQAREPARILEPTAFLAGLLVIRQFDRWFGDPRAGKPRRIAWLALGLVFLSFAAMALTGLGFMRCVTGAALLAVFVFAAAVLDRARWPRLGVSVLAASVMIGEYVLQEPPNVIAMTHPLVYPARGGGYYPIPPLHYAIRPDLTRFLKQTDPTDRLCAFSELYCKGNVSAGAATGNRMLANYHALQLESFVQWFDGITANPLVERTSEGLLLKDNYDVWANPQWITPRSFPVLDLLNIRYLIPLDDPVSSAGFDNAAFHGRFRRKDAGRLTVYENLKALPAAFVVHHAETAASLEQVVARLRQPALDYHTTALVPAHFPIERLEPARGEETVRTVLFASNDWVVHAKMSAPGLLVLTDILYPGWRAVLDGSRTPLYPVYGILKGVLVPEGEHEIRFEFRPRLFTAGMFISMVSLCTVALATLSLARRRNVG
jgi:hypothetical protein